MTITATHNGQQYHPIFICQEWQPRQVSEPWTPAELIAAMIRDGWRPTRVPGRYIHQNTYYESTSQTRTAIPTGLTGQWRDKRRRLFSE